MAGEGRVCYLQCMMSSAGFCVRVWARWLDRWANYIGHVRGGGPGSLPDRNGYVCLAPTESGSLDATMRAHESP